MKKVVTILGILLLVGFLAVPVVAHRGGGCGGSFRGPGDCCEGKGSYSNLTEAQRTELDKLHQKFYDDTVNLRQQIWGKSAELEALLGTSNPDADKARALQREISDSKAKMAEQRINFVLEAKKIAPNAGFGRGYARGYGSHMKGPQGSYGHHGPCGKSGPRGGCGGCPRSQ
jgi:zinc resistance-associated protein